VNASPSTFRVIGTVTRPHGIRGGLKVRPETDDPHRFDVVETLYLGETPGSLSPYSVQSVSYQPQKSGVAIILQLDGVSDRTMVKALSGALVWASEDDLPPLAEGEVFLSDLVGLSVLSEGGERRGEVVDVIDYPAHPTLSIEKEDGSRVLVPFVPQLVSKVRLPEGFLVVETVEGLLDGEALSERS
jgi:16S rRNA processing protein RimM